jgi:hypothetical protein
MALMVVEEILYSEEYNSKRTETGEAAADSCC